MKKQIYSAPINLCIIFFLFSIVSFSKQTIFICWRHLAIDTISNSAIAQVKNGCNLIRTKMRGKNTISYKKRDDVRITICRHFEIIITKQITRTMPNGLQCHLYLSRSKLHLVKLFFYFLSTFTKYSEKNRKFSSFPVVFVPSLHINRSHLSIMWL